MTPSDAAALTSRVREECVAALAVAAEQAAAEQVKAVNKSCPYKGSRGGFYPIWGGFLSLY